MTAIPLAQYLSEFEEGDVEPFHPHGAARAVKPAAFEHLTLVRDEGAGRKRADEPAGRSPGAPADPAADHAKALTEAVAAALEEGRLAMKAELEAAHAEALRSERESAAAAQAAALTAARAEWAEARSSQLAGQLAARLDEMDAAIRSTLTNILRPLAAGARQRQTLAQLAEAVGTMTFDGGAFAIKARGPADLLAAFSEKLGSRREFVSFEADESAGEIRIEADRTVIETRLSGWRAALEEALA